MKTDKTKVGFNKIAGATKVTFKNGKKTKTQIVMKVKNRGAN